MHNTAHEFTVVIPLYNRASLIRETLDTVLQQTLPAVEVIVVDDGSTDESARVVEGFGNRVTLIRNGKQGVQAARNAGINRAPTEWTALCDSDDLWEPTWLERIGALRKAAPDIDFVFGNFRILRDGTLSDKTKFDDAPTGYWKQADPVCLREGWAFQKTLAGQSFKWHPMFPSAMAFSKGLLARTGTFDARLNGCSNEDGEFTLRLLYHAKVGAIPEPLVQIRKQNDSVSSNQLKLLLDEIWSLNFVKQHHAEARPFHAIIDDQIVRRTIQAANLAFVIGDHTLVRSLIKDVPWQRRPPKLRLKYGVALLPGPVALPANNLLQRIAGLG